MPRNSFKENVERHNPDRDSTQIVILVFPFLLKVRELEHRTKTMRFAKSVGMRS